jgi:hypothetical protein
MTSGCKLFLFESVLENLLELFHFGLDNHLAIRLTFVIGIIILMVGLGLIKFGKRF